uniref:ABC transporter family protein n=1 Tax=Rhizophora mucronata TaxID=61149 RepID=A0A2P2KTL6_RHIMU
MELKREVGLLWQQFKALLVKNLLLSWRNKRATFLQLFASLVFILLLFCIDRATRSMNYGTTAYKSVTDPLVSFYPSIPPCEDKLYIKFPCFDFLWSGNDSFRVRNIVRSIMANNPGRAIPSSKVMSFTTKEEVDEWILNNQNRVPGALHFRETNATFISYGLQINSTVATKRGHFEDPTFKFQIPFQVAAEREVARSVIGDSNFGWVVGFKEFAHPARETFSALSTIGPAFFLAFAMFGFVLQISSLVAEKELRLRQSMSMMGLYESAYWLSWITWEGILSLVSSLLLILFGMMFQFDFFKKNNFAVVFLVFFLFQLCMTGLAFMLSAFVSKSTSANTVGFSLFIIGFLTQIVTLVGFPYKKQFSRIIRNVWSLYPPNLLAAAVDLLVQATATPEDAGISWSRRDKCSLDDTECVITINDVYIWLISTFFVWLVLAIYFDNVIPNASGVRKSVFYFLMPGYWTGKGGNKVEEGGICSCSASVSEQEHTIPDDEDVLEEESIIKKDAREGTIDPSVAVQIRGLVKTYAGTRDIGCGKCKKTSPYHALKGLWMNFSEDQLFCLLGPNGAGKTTAINCLTGITPVTSGDALIYGYSIRSSVGMSKIQRLIGVCPQFDILWDALSGQEHINLFASIKGLPPASIDMVAQDLLEKVKLTDSARVRTRSYSGGMKRRLSVAIALIGDPRLVILDEPTTGMDPISRRHVWDIIQDAKKGCAIVLTTHSMEEADILSDRIGIMAKGRLRCIGTSIRLKSKFGTGFVTNVSFAESTDRQTPPYSPVEPAISVDREPVKQFFKQHLEVNPFDETISFLTYVIPHNKESLLTVRISEFIFATSSLELMTCIFQNVTLKAG